MVLPRRTRRALATAARSAALPGSLALLAAATMPAPARAAAPGPDIRILSPRKGDQVGSGAFTIQARFESRSGQGVTVAEVWVDGVRWARRDLMGQMSGTLELALDGSTLPFGKHQIVVKLFCADGSNSSKTLMVEAGNKTGVDTGASQGGPQIQFRSPVNGTAVSGTVDIGVDVLTRNAEQAYVTFFVDNQFKTLTNRPPYNYTWDTTTVKNGLHTVEARASVESTDIPGQRRLQLYVDNPGGETVRMPDIPDLRNPRATTGTAASKPVPPLTIPTPPRKAAGRSGTSLSRPATAATFATNRWLTANPESLGVRMAPPARAGSTTTAIAGPELRLVAPGAVDAALPITPAAPAPDPRPMSVDPMTSATANPAPQTFSPRLATPYRPAANSGGVSMTVKATRPAVGKRTVVAAARPPAKIVRLSPGGVLTIPTGKTRIASAGASVRPAAAGASHRVVAVNGVRVLPAGAKQQRMGKIVQVAFDGQQIAFDVAPRVEAGLPLAPFRQLFEHTGGRVDWVAKNRVVRAVNASREVVITVGTSSARVNNQKVSLSKPAFVEQGRTIVPLSFVSEALDVDVQYDAKTGSLRITSKK